MHDLFVVQHADGDENLVCVLSDDLLAEAVTRRVRQSPARTVLHEQQHFVLAEEEAFGQKRHAEHTVVATKIVCAPRLTKDERTHKLMCTSLQSKTNASRHRCEKMFGFNFTIVSMKPQHPTGAKIAGCT